VRLFLDDFVTGNASLSWLTRFPLDGLKLEAPFVRGLGGDRKVRSLLKAACGMAAAFDLEVVAEGVESEEQATILEELGCQTAQGYLFSRPVPASRLDALLRSALPPRTAAVAGRAGGDGGGATATMGEAAEALGVSPSTVRRWADEGRLTAVRTTGGHRRFLVDEIRRLRSDGRASVPRVRAVQPPEHPLPRTGAFVSEHRDRISGAGLKATYEDGGGGWFAEPAGRAEADAWLWALSAALASGVYADAIEATTALARRARLSGATTVERMTFLDRSCAALLRLCSEAAETRDELPGARRICAALRHSALEHVG
jgi:excisionase family DNA binding protein